MAPGPCSDASATCQRDDRDCGNVGLARSSGVECHAVYSDAAARVGIGRKVWCGGNVGSLMSRCPSSEFDKWWHRTIKRWLQEPGSCVARVAEPDRHASSTCPTGRVLPMKSFTPARRQCRLGTPVVSRDAAKGRVVAFEPNPLILKQSEGMAGECPSGHWRFEC